MITVRKSLNAAIVNVLYAAIAAKMALVFWRKILFSSELNSIDITAFYQFLNLNFSINFSEEEIIIKPK